MTDSTPNPDGRGDERPTARTESAPNPTHPVYPASPAGWGAAPTPTSTATLDAPAPPSGLGTPRPSDAGYAGAAYDTARFGHAPAGPSSAAVTTDPYAASWNAGAPSGSTPWYGAGATTKRTGGPRPPWFWPLVAVAVGSAALLVGGGIGFAIGHAIGGTSQSTTQVPGTNGGTNQFPGGGTGRFPGNGTQDGTGTQGGTGTGSGSTGTGTGTGSTGSGSGGSAANS